MWPRARSLFEPHRMAIMLVFAVLVLCMIWFMRWDWLPAYGGRLAAGTIETLIMLFSTAIVGFFLAVPIGLVQVTGPKPLAWLSLTFCTIIRGTPLLLQLWLLYYGLGSIFAQYPGNPPAN